MTARKGSSARKPLATQLLRRGGVLSAAAGLKAGSSGASQIRRGEKHDSGTRPSCHHRASWAGSGQFDQICIFSRRCGGRDAVSGRQDGAVPAGPCQITIFYIAVLLPIAARRWRSSTYLGRLSTEAKVGSDCCPNEAASRIEQPLIATERRENGAGVQRETGCASWTIK